MDKITINNMRFYAYHGVYEVERELGQFFEVDIELYGDFREAGETDNPEKALDYGAVHGTVQNATTSDKFQLLERVAENIANEVLKKYSISKVRVRVRKRTVPILSYLVDYVEAEITRER